MDDWIAVKRILQGGPSFYKAFFELTDDLAAALFLSQACYWTNIKEKSDEDNGWFYKSAEEWKEETCLSWHMQKKSRTILLNLGVLEEQNMRSEHRIYFRVNYKKLLEKVGGLKIAPQGSDLTPSDCQSEDVREAIAQSEIRSYSETTQKITPESTGASPTELDFKNFCISFRRIFARGSGKEKKKRSLWESLCVKYGVDEVRDALEPFAEDRKRKGRKLKEDEYAIWDFLNTECSEIIDTKHVERAAPESKKYAATKPPDFLRQPKEPVTKEEKENWEKFKKTGGG